jgi:hypothetical protein
MRWTLGLYAIAALVFVTGGCGSTISVPDQGIIVTGCQMPAKCYRSDCSCKFADVDKPVTAAGSCVVDPVCSDPNDNSTCNCPTAVVLDADAGTGYDSLCIETAQACVGHGVFCGGAGALCQRITAPACDGSGDPPMLIPTIGMPTLEPHCEFVDDVCCPGTSPSDGGVTTD